VPTVSNLRRFYMLKRFAAETVGQRALADAWRAKHDATPGTALAVDFPARALLVAAGYDATEDLEGADSAELMAVGLTASQASAVLGAL
jgi:hypothetical protein